MVIISQGIQHALLLSQHVARWQAAPRTRARLKLAGSRARPSCSRSSLWSWWRPSMIGPRRSSSAGCRVALNRNKSSPSSAKARSSRSLWPRLWWETSLRLNMVRDHRRQTEISNLWRNCLTSLKKVKAKKLHVLPPSSFCWTVVWSITALVVHECAVDFFCYTLLTLYFLTMTTTKWADKFKFQLSFPILQFYNKISF